VSVPGDREWRTSASVVDEPGDRLPTPGRPVEDTAMNDAYYWDYLQLDKLLDAQHPRSGGDGTPPAHDETLFIIVHQAYELWFKQILHELDDAIALMDRDVVPEEDVGRVVARLRRIVTIQRLLIDQLDVLETMPALDFLEFRDALVPASGFQSVQFRIIENRLGLLPQRRLSVKGAAYTDVLRSDHAEKVHRTEDAPTLHRVVERWLERTPFLQVGHFAFWRHYRAAVSAMLDEDERIITERAVLDDADRQRQLAMLERTRDSFTALFDAERYAELQREGARHLSREAVLAALLIHLHRDQPILQMPYQLLSNLVDVDEGFTSWRQRHVLMVQRMIGTRIGTGGTSGSDYLEQTARRHRVFADLFDLASLLIPRSALPPLPEHVTRGMQFRPRAGGETDTTGAGGETDTTGARGETDTTGAGGEADITEPGS
jgi:tryptophan 2,3-dioxygenase